MKEYKVITPKLGFRNRNQKLEDLLNNYAREGWNVKSLVGSYEGLSFIALERDKNR